MRRASNTKVLRALEIAADLASEETPSALLSRVLDLTVDVLQAERGFIVVPDPKGAPKRPFAVKAGHNLNGDAWSGEELFSRTFVRATIDRGKALLSQDPHEDPLFEGSDTLDSLPVRSILGAPLVAHGKTHGALVLHESSRAEGPFHEEDLQVLETLVRIAYPFEELLDRSAVSTQLAEKRLVPKRRFPKLVGSSPSMRELFAALEKVCAVAMPVLILGETGTGKELVAQSIHEEGPRRKERFVALNVTTVTEHLLESELFGHVKGAFTGAASASAGVFRSADRGTLFLDEIGDLPLAAQVKLLRALDEKAVRPVGSAETIPVDVRIVAATHRDLRALVSSGKFREDLYHRLNVLTVRTPPLRERGEDVFELARFFLARASLEAGRGDPPELGPEARAAFARHAWPGNVRELWGAICRAVVSGRDPIEPADLQLGSAEDLRKPSPPERKLTRTDIRKAIKEAGSVSGAAKLLKTSRATLYRKYPDVLDI